MIKSCMTRPDAVQPYRAIARYGSPVYDAGMGAYDGMTDQQLIDL
jgi:hypothetical protein